MAREFITVTRKEEDKSEAIPLYLLTPKIISGIATQFKQGSSIEEIAVNSVLSERAIEALLRISLFYADFSIGR